ncbi:ribosomal RNA large subunit methyltransferase F [Exophiala viscosa]|uniref:ribosomal RNA large subunit methyltransferase F n=1 Tax=Exophiala viscosa TaxID=2486360 RepID=UPI002195FF5C|nr:ribosomal RNA large subunit methyltransferase F [Exophiala viscosa]
MPAPDDVYKHDVDFTTLALQYPDFAKKLKSNRQLDFSDPESVRQLTKTLLHRDFDIAIDLPEDRLCPPVPNRFNYILFIQRLLDCTSPDFRDGYNPDRQVIGLDVGTGASAIYPLLACQQRPIWLFLATEIDDKSRMYAEKNIATNMLQSRIRLLSTDITGAELIPSKQLERFDRIDILMTNPPFYESQESMLESSRSKSRPANSSCTGAPVEMITPGGEVSFVSRLIDESTLSTNRTRIQWFSAMLGKLSSVGFVVETLRQKRCTNFAVTEFIQGQKTRRWCVAWSWFGFRPSSAVARSVGSGVEKKFLPPPTDIEFDVHADMATLEIRTGEEIGKLDVLWKYVPARRVGMLMSKGGDVWSRKARRRRVHQDHEMADRDDDHEKDEKDEEQEPALVARITLSAAVVVDSRVAGSAKTNVHIRHLQGQDSVLFESFCGWLKRKIS